jgi:AcrR family transcriptional regulator
VVTGTAGETHRTTRDALMDAALDLLEERGVLAGLNLREVADRVGVTAANIYHLFGSRQGLLRAALARETEGLSSAFPDGEQLPYVERRVRMFDAIGSRPRLALTALLALDGDPDFRPFPFLDATLARYREEVASGELPASVDYEAAHVMSLAASIAVAIYGDAAARQLAISPEELRARIRTVFAQMYTSLVEDDTRGTEDAPERDDS